MEARGGGHCRGGGVVEYARFGQSRGWNRSELIITRSGKGYVWSFQGVELDRFSHSRGWKGAGVVIPGGGMGQVWSFQGVE